MAASAHGDRVCWVEDRPAACPGQRFVDVDGSPPARRRRSVSGDCFVACANQRSGFAVGASG